MAKSPFGNYLDIFKNMGDASLKSSFFDFQDSPNYSLLSEGISDDGETSPFSTDDFNPDNISEIQPAENTAQRWSRQSDDLKKAGKFSALYAQWKQGVDALWESEQKRGFTAFVPEEQLLAQQQPKTTTPVSSPLVVAAQQKYERRKFYDIFHRIDATPTYNPRNDINHNFRMDYAY